MSEAWFNANVTLTTSPPPTPFSGIVYYDPPGGDWSGAVLDGCSGILIVHNASNSAMIRNMHGTFSGLIISDKLEKNTGNATVYGAVITTALADSLVATLTVRYSSKVLNDLKSLVGNQTSQWKKVILSGSWKEQ